MEVNTILFDFFGTLVAYTPGDYFHKQRKKAYTFLLEHGYNERYYTWKERITKTYTKQTVVAKQSQNEFHIHDFMRNVLTNALPNTPSQEFIEKLTQVYLDDWSEDVHEIPKIHDLLSRLSQTYTLGIISNTHHPTLVQSQLQRFAMDQYFTHITTSIDHGKIKPNKTIFADTLALLQIKPTQTIFIGDNYEDDYQGGTGAGIQTYLLDPHKHYLHLGKNRIEQISDIAKHL